MGEDVQEGDCRYMAPELLNDYLGENDDDDTPNNENQMLQENTKNFRRYRKNDLTKADVFSLGATFYELMIGEELPKNGEKWSDIRHGKLDLSEEKLVSHFSRNFKELIIKMLEPNAKERISADEILDKYLPSEEEVKIKFQKMVIRN